MEPAQHQTQPSGEPPELNNQEVAKLFQLPSATPGVVDPIPSKVQPATGSASGEVDHHDVVYDPRRHEHRIRPNGHWALKRGNGARLAAGKPLAGASSGHSMRVSADPAPAPSVSIEPPATAGEAVTQPQGSRLGPFLALDEAKASPVSGGPQNASAPPAAGGAPMVPEVMRTPQDYHLTAEGITQAQFGVMSMALGKAWEAEPQEAKAWTEAWKRTMAHYQTPILGPIVELIVLGIGSVSKRWHDATTNARVGGFWRWIRKQPPKVAGDNTPSPARA